MDRGEAGVIDATRELPGEKTAGGAGSTRPEGGMY